MADEFDVLHFHIDVLHYPLIRDFRRSNGDDAAWPPRSGGALAGLLGLSRRARSFRFRTISESLCRRSNWAGTVYHGLPHDLLPFNPSPTGGYVAFLGRISPEKRPDRAIEIAARAGARLKIAAKIDRVDQAYWDDVIKPMVEASPNVEFVGEISEREKVDFLGNADALLFPIDWPEPFGLVMIEAMACGTPVIAFRCGSTPESLTTASQAFSSTILPKRSQPLQRVGALDRVKARANFRKALLHRARRFRLYADLPQPSRLARRLCGSVGAAHEIRPGSRRPTGSKSRSVLKRGRLNGACARVICGRPPAERGNTDRIRCETAGLRKN